MYTAGRPFFIPKGGSMDRKPVEIDLNPKIEELEPRIAPGETGFPF